MAVQVMTQEQVKARQLQAAMLLDLVCEEFGVSSDHVRGQGRKKPVVEARYIAAFLMNLVELLPEDMISPVLNRSEPTIISYAGKGNDLLAADASAGDKARAAWRRYKEETRRE